MTRTHHSRDERLEIQIIKYKYFLSLCCCVALSHFLDSAVKKRPPNIISNILLVKPLYNYRTKHNKQQYFSTDNDDSLSPEPDGFWHKIRWCVPSSAGYPDFYFCVPRNHASGRRKQGVQR